MTGNELVVVIRDDRVKSNNRLATALSLFSLTLMVSAFLIRSAAEAVIVKINKAANEADEPTEGHTETKETESEGE